MPRTPLPNGVKILPPTARCSCGISVPSETMVGKSYIIAFGPDGLPACSCPAFIYRKNRNCGCKHLLAYQHLTACGGGTETPKRRNHRSKGTKPESTWTVGQMDAAIAAFGD